MNRLAKLINGLGYEDLRLIQKDLDAGNIEKLVKRKLKEAKAQRITNCPVCGEQIKEGEGFHLEFGSQGLRKKATFDGPDCMEYFLTRMKKK